MLQYVHATNVNICKTRNVLWYYKESVTSVLDSSHPGDLVDWSICLIYKCCIVSIFPHPVLLQIIPEGAVGKQLFLKGRGWTMNLYLDFGQMSVAPRTGALVIVLTKATESCKPTRPAQHLPTEPGFATKGDISAHFSTIGVEHILP